MKLSTLFSINAVVAILFGLVFVLAPGLTLSLYGIPANPALNFMGQLFGAALVGFAVISWSARNEPASNTRNAILMGFFVGDAIGFIASLIGQLQGIANPLGWSTVAIYLILALAFAYFRFLRS